jgi:hypothetical protein
VLRFVLAPLICVVKCQRFGLGSFALVTCYTAQICGWDTGESGDGSNARWLRGNAAKGSRLRDINPCTGELFFTVRRVAQRFHRRNCLEKRAWNCRGFNELALAGGAPSYPLLFDRAGKTRPAFASVIQVASQFSGGR